MIIADTFTTGMISVNVECDYIGKYTMMNMMIHNDEYDDKQWWIR